MNSFVSCAVNDFSVWLIIQGKYPIGFHSSIYLYGLMVILLVAVLRLKFINNPQIN